MEIADEPSHEAKRLLRAANGDQAAWAELLGRHQARLRRTGLVRLDRRLKGRIDPSDVLQEASLEAAKALPKYAERPDLPFFLWLRWLTGMRLQPSTASTWASALGTPAARSQIFDGPIPNATSAALAAQLLGHDTRPSFAAVRAEQKLRLQEAIDRSDPSTARCSCSATLRIDRRGDRPRHRHRTVGREQAIREGVEAAEGPDRRQPRRGRRLTAMSSDPSGRRRFRPAGRVIPRPPQERRDGRAWPNMPSATPPWPTDPRPVPRPGRDRGAQAGRR